MSIKNYLTESVDDATFDRTIKRIEKMTDQNDHNGARMLGAEFLSKLTRGKAKKFEEIYKAIEVIANKEGSMPRPLMDYRFSVDKQMWAMAKSELDKDKYEAFYGAY